MDAESGEEGFKKELYTISNALQITYSLCVKNNDFTLQVLMDIILNSQS